MEVRNFVKTTLVQIIQGVGDAIEETKGASRSVVNPSLSHSTYSTPQNVSFDIAVTVQEDAANRGTGDIKVLGLTLGMGGQESLSNTAYSRISFSVPVALPSVAQKQYKD